MKKKIFSFIIISLLFGLLLFLLRPSFLESPYVVKDAETVFFPSSPFTGMINYVVDKFVNNMSISVVITSIVFGVLSMFLILLFIDSLTTSRLKKIMLVVVFITLSSIKAFSFYLRPIFLTETSKVHYSSHASNFIFSALLYMILAYFYLKGKISVYWIYFAFVLSIFFYAQTVILLPSLIFIYLLASKVEVFNYTNIKKAILNNNFLKFIGFCVLIAAIFFALSDLFIYSQFKEHIHQRGHAVVGDYLGGSDARIFTNIIKENHYPCCDSVFSLDYLKFYFLLMAVISFHIIIISLFFIKKEIRKNAYLNFLLISLLYYLAWFFFYNPETIVKEMWLLYAPATFFGFMLYAYTCKFQETKKVFKISLIVIALNIISFIALLKLIN